MEESIYIEKVGVMDLSGSVLLFDEEGRCVGNRKIQWVEVGNGIYTESTGNAASSAI